MAEGISLILLLLGALFMLLAAIGMVRMPDVLTRMHSERHEIIHARCGLDHAGGRPCLQ
jgi:multisubunit Na+/H+ antiporter MnhG subunit